jgi:adenosylmethionine-8-amino-7-oxononanoate aminotransferase
LAAQLADLAPEGHNKVFFVSGGSEAVESCIKLARQYAVATGQEKRWRVISREPSYHGSTLGALAVTGYGPLNAPFTPMLREMPKIPAPRCYLDRDNFSDAERGIRYAEMLREKIVAIGPESVLAFIMEPIGGASTGALVAPDTYDQRIREICDEFGILLIYDEVMTGAGRTGKYFAAEHWGINPDIIALAKGLGAGYMPLGAMLAQDRIVDPVLDSGGFQHGYTYAGNPLACVAGLAVVEEIFANDLMTNTVFAGDLLRRELEKLKDACPLVGDVRGKGLLLAFELVSDRETMRPLPANANAYLRLVELAYERGLILYARRTRGGMEGDHFLVCPPMITTAAQVAEIIEPLTESLRTFADELDSAHMTQA